MALHTLDQENLKGPQKAAIFLLAMGEAFATSFFRKMDDRSIKELGQYMSEITVVPNQVLDAVMSEFLDHFENDVTVCVSGRSFLKDVVSKSLDEQTARKVYEAIGSATDHEPFSDLNYIPAGNLVSLLKGEHPQTIALILSHLPQEKAAEILGLLPEQTKVDIALRIVKMDHVQEDLIKELDETLRRDIASIKNSTNKIDGIEKLASILNEVDGKTEEDVLSFIEQEEGDLAEKIRQKMFIFEDLVHVEDRNFREILQNVDNQEVVKSLKTASEEMKEKIFRNLSQRAAEMLREDMEVMGPVKLREVEEAQQAIIRTAKRLETEGKIVLGGKGKEDALV